MYRKFFPTHALCLLLAAAPAVLAENTQETTLAPVNVKDKAETATSPVAGYVAKRSAK